MTSDPSTDAPLWGEQTALAVANFPISGRPLDLAVVRALALVKRHAAAVNVSLGGGAGGLDDAMATAIADACRAVERGDHDDAFPVDTYQTGSGTSTNMNVNEVVATLASRALGYAVHPNDHVNASQSSNDTVPSAIRIAVARAVANDLLPAIDVLATELGGAAERFADVVKAGRTHLMDAAPVTVGQELAAWAYGLRLARERLVDELPRLGELPLGGTATGTGLNAPAGFAAAVVERCAQDTGLPLRAAASTPARMAHMGGQGTLADVSSALRAVAIAFTKMANDIRLLGSGPLTGLGELQLPTLQAGSSIMPGKVNPVLCETANQVAARVFGNDATVAFASSQGILELNTYLPVMADALLESVRLLAATARTFATKLVAGLQVDGVRCQRNADRTPALATALGPLIGYDEASAVVKEALATDRTVLEVAVANGHGGEAELRAALDPARMT